MTLSLRDPTALDLRAVVGHDGRAPLVVRRTARLATGADGRAAAACSVLLDRWPDPSTPTPLHHSVGLFVSATLDLALADDELGPGARRAWITAGELIAELDGVPVGSAVLAGPQPRAALSFFLDAARARALLARPERLTLVVAITALRDAPLLRPVRWSVDTGAWLPGLIARAALLGPTDRGLVAVPPRTRARVPAAAPPLLLFGDRLVSPALVLHASAVRPPASMVAALGHGPLVNPIRLPPGIADLVLQPAGDRPPDRPVVGDPTDSYFGSARPGAPVYYAPALRWVSPARTDTLEAAPFTFRMTSGGVTSTGEPALTATVRFTVERTIAPETQAALDRDGLTGARPVPAGDPSVWLDVPFRDGGIEHFERFPARVVGRDGERFTAEVTLHDAWVRLAYGALAYGQAPFRPARVGMATTFAAAVPYSIDETRIGLVGKRIEAQRLRGDAGAPLRPSIQIAPVELPRIRKARWASRSVVVERTVEARVACGEAGALYVREEGGQTQAIGCTDALRLGELRYRQLEELPALATERLRVYALLSHPGTFIVLPAAYRIARFPRELGPDRAYRPAALLCATSSATSEPQYYFAASLAPDVAPDELDALTDALRARVPAGTTPRIELPRADRFSRPPVVRWVCPPEIATPIELWIGDSFQVALAAPLAATLALLELMKDVGLRGALEIPTEDGSVLRSILIVDTQATGPMPGGPLALSLGLDRATLTNAVERPVIVHGLRSRGADGAPAFTPLARTLAPGEAVEVPLPPGTAHAIPVAREALGPLPIRELRLFADDITTTVTFLDQIDHHARGIEGLTVLVDAGDGQARELNLAQDGSVSTLVTLPLTAHLAPDSLQFSFRIRINGSTQVTSPHGWDLAKDGAFVAVTPALLGLDKE